MKKILYLISMILIISCLSSCTRLKKTPTITQPVLSKSIDTKTSKPIEPWNTFNQNDLVIYFTVQVEDLPKNTNLTAIWKYLLGGTEVKSELKSKGSGFEAFSLKKGTKPFPPGQYEVIVTAQAEGKYLETKGSFEIITETPKAHLLNPVTSKGVDSNDSLNPVNIVSEFTQSDPVIYFIVKSQELPKDTKVTCMWFYVNTGETLSHQMITEGSRNILFTLKPEIDQVLPPGKYIAIASVTIDGKIESVSKEFEIKNNQ